ncbi:MAG: hypothetical protein JWM34_2957 [Ilumatobacteraceae bacterium]|nr:hypothetical protein [Ilumatobacteraceae bacterium]
MGRSLMRLRWWNVLLMAVIAGFIIACLGAAFTTLQTPAGPFVCRNGVFLAGNTKTIVHDADGTSNGFNVDSSCVDKVTGLVRHLNGIEILGILWLIYGVFAFVVLLLVVMLVRSIRVPRQLRIE